MQGTASPLEGAERQTNPAACAEGLSLLVPRPHSPGTSQGSLLDRQNLLAR